MRAITWMATPENEETLVEWARYGTTGQLKRIVRGYREVLAAEELGQVNERHARRHLRWSWGDAGSLVVSVRLDPEEGDGEAAIEVTPVRWSGKAAWEAAKPLGFSGVTPAGAVVLAAVEAYEGGSGEPPPSVREPAEARRADALLAVAEAALAAGHADHPTASVAEVSVVIDVDVLADDGEGTFELAPTASPYTGEGGDGLRHRPCAGP